MKSQALFVDDEPLVLNGLRRMLRSLRHDWGMSFATSGKEGLALLEKQEFTVVISDMRMPEMDGAVFLGEVATRHPAVARLVLSGHAELDAILRAVRPAHQFLAKPCDPKQLEGALRRINQVRLDHDQGTICRTFGAHRRLPSLESSIDQLRHALSQAPVDLNRIGDIVNADIAMSVQVLRLANSAFFGPPTRTLDPAKAVTTLGPEIMKSLLDEVCLFRPVLEHIERGEEAVRDINQSARDHAEQRPCSLMPPAEAISAQTLAMLSLAGSLAAIETPEALNDGAARSLSKILIAFWGLDVDIDVLQGTPEAHRNGAALPSGGDHLEPLGT